MPFHAGPTELIILLVVVMLIFGVGKLPQVGGGFDAVVPMIDGFHEPTHALYSKSCLPHIRRRLEGGDLKITHFYDEVRVRVLSEREVDRLDPGHHSFFNVSAEADLGRALALLASGY